MPDPQPLNLEEPKENSLMRHLRDVISDRTGLINSEAISLLYQYDELRATCVALEQERDELRSAISETQKVIAAYPELEGVLGSAPKHLWSQVNYVVRNWIDAGRTLALLTDDRDQLRTTLAQYEATQSAIKDVLWEIVHHMYDKQDMNRVRELARPLLKQMETSS